MNLCIPVTDDKGAASPICAHFGSAPWFVIADTERGSFRSIRNRNLHHVHGACSPLGSLLGERIEGFIVGGIGAGALGKLDAAGLPVFRSPHATAGEAVAAFGAGDLATMDPGLACAQHGRGHR